MAPAQKFPGRCRRFVIVIHYVNYLSVSVFRLPGSGIVVSASSDPCFRCDQASLGTSVTCVGIVTEHSISRRYTSVVRLSDQRRVFLPDLDPELYGCLYCFVSVRVCACVFTCLPVRHRHSETGLLSDVCIYTCVSVFLCVRVSAFSFARNTFSNCLSGWLQRTAAL